LGVFVETLNLAVPAAYMWLAVFYCLFHSYLNMWAELTRFGDRRFYSDWWNANNLGEYWRKWNQPIHNWLIRHVYYPLRRRKVSAGVCLLMTFTVSAVCHEFVVVGIFSVVNFIAFILMMLNVPCMLLQRYMKNRISGTTNNTLFWLFYVILG
jgi:diacylglycerol O-acyltransferase-1